MKKKKAVEKVRVPFDVSTNLKDYFTNRVKNIGLQAGVTEALKAAMYKMLTMTDEELKNFISDGKGIESMYSIFEYQLDRYVQEGLIRGDYQLGQPSDIKVLSAILGFQHSVGEKNIDDLKQKIAEIEKG